MTVHLFLLLSTRIRVPIIIAFALLVMGWGTPFAQTPTQASNEKRSEAARKPRLAVVDFDVVGQGIEAEAGRALAENLLGYFGTEEYDLVERGVLKRLLDEQNLQASDLVADAARTAQIGEMLGVRYLVTGSINRFGQLNISARLIDAETARIERTAVIRGADTSALASQLPTLAARLQGRAVSEPTVGAAASPPSGWEPGRQAGERRVLSLGGGVEMPLRWIPPGEFTMGSPSNETDRDNDEGPQTRVRLTSGFWMAETETTIRQWKTFVQTTDHETEAERANSAWALNLGSGTWEETPGRNWRSPGFSQSDDHPVVCVSWNDANAFGEWLARLAGTEVTLPTEAQWEYACRAGTSTAYAFGSEPKDGQGWLNGADETPWSDGTNRQWSNKFPFRDGYFYTAPAGSFRANAWGLRDMHGNVWEWCQDWYYDKLLGGSVANSSGPNSGTSRVYRGGSWGNHSRYCRSAHRNGDTPVSRGCLLGFRVVLLPD